MISAVNHRQQSSGNRGPTKPPQRGGFANAQTTYLIMLNKKLLLVILFLVFQFVYMFAQNNSPVPKQKIVVFAPLYLDSAFDKDNNYRYDKSFPKFINPGLEFYEGMQLAFDSLNKEKAQLEVFVYDTRSATKTLAQQIAEMDSVNLVIAYATIQENWILAEAAKKRNILYINANLPNDGSIPAIHISFFSIPL